MSKSSIVNLKNGQKFIVQEDIASVTTRINRNNQSIVCDALTVSNGEINVYGQILFMVKEIETIVELTDEMLDLTKNSTNRSSSMPVFSPNTRINFTVGSVDVLELYEDVIKQINQKQVESQYDELAEVQNKSLELTSVSKAGSLNQILISLHLITFIQSVSNYKDMSAWEG